MSDHDLHATPLSDEEFDRLESLLDAPALAEAMRLDEIQGYLCAALSGPQPLDQESRLFDILGGDEAIESEAGREAAQLIDLLAEKLATEMASGQEPTLLLYPKDETPDSPSDYLPWCQAYLAGVDQASEDWFEYFADDDSEETEEKINYLDERLFPLMVLTGEAEAAAKEHGEDWPEDEERRSIEEECENDLPQAIVDIYRFWLAERGIQPIHNDGAKVGRNDPCPCGSGRKFKQCCGRD